MGTACYGMVVCLSVLHGVVQQSDHSASSFNMLIRLTVAMMTALQIDPKKWMGGKQACTSGQRQNLPLAFQDTPRVRHSNNNLTPLICTIVLTQHVPHFLMAIARLNNAAKQVSS